MPRQNQRPSCLKCFTRKEAQLRCDVSCSKSQFETEKVVDQLGGLVRENTSRVVHVGMGRRDTHGDPTIPSSTQ